MIEQNKFFIKKLKNIVFIGETKIFEELKIINDKFGFKTFFITSSHQFKKINKEKKK